MLACPRSSAAAVARQTPVCSHTPCPAHTLGVNLTYCRWPRCCSWLCSIAQTSAHQQTYAGSCKSISHAGKLCSSRQATLASLLVTWEQAWRAWRSSVPGCLCMRGWFHTLKPCLRWAGPISMQLPSCCCSRCRHVLCSNALRGHQLPQQKQHSRVVQGLSTSSSSSPRLPCSCAATTAAASQVLLCWRR